MEQSQDYKSFRDCKVGEVLSKILGNWKELEPLEAKLRDRLATVAEGLSTPSADASEEELDLFFERLAEGGHVWEVAGQRSLLPDARLQAVARLLQIPPSQYDDLCWALETLRANSDVLARGEDDFNNYVQDLAQQLEKGAYVGDLLGAIEKKNRADTNRTIVEESRFAGLPNAESTFLKAVGLTVDSPLFAAEPNGEHGSLKMIAEDLCRHIRKILSPGDLELYLEADSEGIANVRLHRVSELLSALHIFSRSEFLVMAAEIIEGDRELKSWIFNDDHHPASWFLGNRIAYDKAAKSVHVAREYLLLARKLWNAALEFDAHLIEGFRSQLKVDSRGRSDLPRTSGDSVGAGKWTIDRGKSLLVHDDHVDRPIKLTNSAREVLLCIFERFQPGQDQAYFDQIEVMREARSRVKTRKTDTTSTLREWAFGKPMNIFWGTGKLLGSAVPMQRDQNHHRYKGRYLKGALVVDLTVPFPSK